jgi:hypothetical protein
LWSYISSKTTGNNQFKNEAKRKFRASLLTFFDSNYDFSLVSPTENVRDFIIRNFYKLNGRIYRPANFATTNSFILALQEGESAQIYLEQNTNGDFTIAEYHLT